VLQKLIKAEVLGYVTDRELATLVPLNRKSVKVASLEKHLLHLQISNLAVVRH
jgi:hypothetical protein